MRGRYPAGLECVDELDGEAEAKKRLQVVLKTLLGQLRVLQACAELEIGETSFRQLRERILQAGLDALRPQRPGRRPNHEPPTVERLRELEQALAEKELELRQAQVREEIALILPAAADETRKKGRRAIVKLRKRKPR